ncbi:secondary glycine betaine transporter BetU [Klebsiella pneumoniae]|nr:secondary glycine betaine transporter BetU [Klebsiella pneumoniae]
MFIARISRGRTIREFVFGVLFVPAGFTLLWMTFFGNTAIDLIKNQGATALATVVHGALFLCHADGHCLLCDFC